MTSSILDGEKEKTLNVEDSSLTRSRKERSWGSSDRRTAGAALVRVLCAQSYHARKIRAFQLRTTTRIVLWYLHFCSCTWRMGLSLKENAARYLEHVNNSIAETTSKARTRPTRAKRNV